jgi:hypothetical protein
MTAAADAKLLCGALVALWSGAMTIQGIATMFNCRRAMRPVPFMPSTPEDAPAEAPARVAAPRTAGRKPK